jgi:preprotein translocase subunit SecE
MAKKDDERDDDSEREDDMSERDEESTADTDAADAAAPSEETEEEPAPASAADRQAAELATEARALAEEGPAPVVQIGVAKYVHAAFFTAGILGAYLSAKLIETIWGALADWPAATRAVPFLLRFAEDERGTYALGAGALIGVIAVIQTYRNERIRRWADEVAIELSKVSWPTKETVTNGTIVVFVASAIATVYVALLDRFWAFLSQLVYGAFRTWENPRARRRGVDRGFERGSVRAQVGRSGSEHAAFVRRSRRPSEHAARAAELGGQRRQRASGGSAHV